MLIPRGSDEFEAIWRKHHESVALILWDKHGWASSQEHIYTSSELPVLPPNATSLNVPIWWVVSYSFHLFSPFNP